MEIEKEKRKIEFWSDFRRIDCMLDDHKPKKPFEKAVEVIVILNRGGKSEVSVPGRSFMPISELAGIFDEYLVKFKYVTTWRLISHISISLRESTHPGISFFMQEVE